MNTMDTRDWELADRSEADEERARRQRKKRNDAFRRKLNEQRIAHVESLHLKLAASVALLAWAYAGMQYFR